MNHLSTLYEVKGNFKGKSLGNPKHGIGYLLRCMLKCYERS
nr:MAG TPA: hypothetical protein [Caudoviricetes sp.]